MLKFDILFNVPGMPFDGRTVKEKSLGGSESAGYYMARALAKRGHRVTVFCNTETPSSTDGVDYLPIDAWHQFVSAAPFDVAIAQRVPEIFNQVTSARLNILWCHDLVTKKEFARYRSVAWNLDKVLCVSNYHKQHFADTLGLPDTLLYATRNGIDLDLFADGPTARDRKLLVYASRPERGLDVLLGQIMPALLQRDPSYRLALTGYDNSAPHLNDFYQHCQALAQRLGNSVVVLPPHAKEQLAKLYERAGAYVYPTPSPVSPAFAEVSCITAMEAQAAGLPLITSDRGALTETIHPQAGVFLDPTAPDYIEKFVQAIIDTTGNVDTWRSMSEAGRKHAKGLSWDGVAEDWERLFIGEIEQRASANPITTARHFLKRGDIVAAREAVGNLDGEQAHAIAADIATNYAHAFGGSLSDHHSAVSGDEYAPETLSKSVDGFPMAARTQELMRWASANIGQNKRILDYGCGFGGASFLLANNFRAKVYGVDFDLNALAAANYLKSSTLDPEDRCTFSADGRNIYAVDFAVCLDALQQSPTPWETVGNIEEVVKDGGRILITVPFGPKAGNDARRKLWDFDFHDLHDMFEGKKNLKTWLLAGGNDEKTLEPIGWYFISYEKQGDAPTNIIDMGRKLRHQAPIQTVSANIMAGPNSEETLEWSMKSYRDIVDEIIVADCGMNDVALAIANRYGAKIITAPDPKQVGFDVPRNIGLDACTSDWVMWVDTDERVIDGVNLFRYLRHNMLQGYGIRQHHFAVDAQFDPDLPVRLFRNNRTLKWFGKVHEHPETALNKGPGEVVILSDVHIAHVGYLIESVRRKRFDRNYPLMHLDLKENPDRMLQKLFIMRDSMLVVRYMLDRTRGKLNEDISNRCHDVVAVWRKYFRGKRDQMTNTDPIDYYSQANAVLGVGFDVVFDLQTDDLDAKPGKPIKIRFANAEDYEIEMVARMKSRIPVNHGGSIDGGVDVAR